MSHCGGERGDTPRNALGGEGSLVGDLSQVDPPGSSALAVLAILIAIVTNEIHGRQGALMMVFYLINTLVAVIIGLSLTNLIQTGRGASLAEPGAVSQTAGP
jgi:hypothetical protein